MADELKYRGVRKRKWGKYVSEIRLPNCRDRIWLGSYDTAEKAARAFDAALFCLRGSSAKFNFSDDPPNIAGGQSLNPAEIQAVAQQYANSYGGGPSSGRQAEVEADGARYSEFDGARANSAAAVDLIDRSFWEMVDRNGGGHNAGSVSEFGFYPEPGEMYIPPHYETRVYEDDEEQGYYDNGNAHYSLWNF